MAVCKISSVLGNVFLQVLRSFHIPTKTDIDSVRFLSSIQWCLVLNHLPTEIKSSIKLIREGILASARDNEANIGKQALEDLCRATLRRKQIIIREI